MNMTSTLTSRDKKLLYMLVFVVIIFIFGWCLIRPLYKGTVEDQESITIANSLKAANEAKVIGLTSAQALTDRFSADIDETTSVYYDYMDSSEIDKLVTSYILKKGLLARDLTISMPGGPVNEHPYIYSNVTQVQTAGTGAVEDTSYQELTASGSDTDEKNESDEGEIKSSAYYRDAALGFLTGYNTDNITIVPTPMESYAEGQRNVSSTESSNILCVRLNIVVEGDPAVEQAVIDDLTHNPSLRVTGFNWIKLDPAAFVLEDGSIVMVESEARQLQISVNLYMNNKQE